jgi:hypothetical protein
MKLLHLVCSSIIIIIQKVSSGSYRGNLHCSCGAGSCINSDFLALEDAAQKDSEHESRHDYFEDELSGKAIPSSFHMTWFEVKAFITMRA